MRYENHPIMVLLGLHSYGLSPEEETSHARFWFVLLLMSCFWTFLLGLQCGGH